jgi:hypothetical protein
VLQQKKSAASRTFPKGELVLGLSGR